MALLGVIGEFLGSIFTPAQNIIDRVVTTDKDRMTLKNELEKIQSDVMSKMIELEKSRLDAQARIQTAEATSTHWVQGNWRPIVSLSLVALICLDSFGVAKCGPQIYQLAEIFLGVVASSRGIEKVAGSLTNFRK